MTLSIIVAILACLALLFLISMARGRATAHTILENPAEHIRSVDVEAFRNLIDPEETEFLRAHLVPADFRRIQRERLRAAVEYIRCAAQNAAVLLHMAEAARRSPDAATAAAAEKLVDHAVRLRLYAFQAMGRLYLDMLLHGKRSTPLQVADRYEQMTRDVVLLGLKYPTGGVPSAL